MEYTLPGTEIEIGKITPGASESIFSNIFSGGGLVLSQVVTMTGLEPYVIQNWVKRGFVSPPIKRLYSKRQFSRIVIINMLRETLQIEKIISLLSYLNGQLDDESDDIIDDSVLYHYFVSLISEPGFHGEISMEHLKAVTSDFSEPLPGGKKRLEKVLEIMALAYCSAELKKKTDQAMAEIK